MSALTQPRRAKLPFALGWIPVLLLLLLLPLGAELQLFSNFYINLFTKIFIFSVLLLGYDLLAGFTGMVSFGHAMFFGLGAYTTGLILIHSQALFGLPPELTIWLGMLMSVLLCAVVGMIVGFLSIRTHGVYFIFITLAFAQFFHSVAFHWSDVTGGENGLPGIKASTFLGIDHQTNYYYFVLAVLLLCYMLIRRVVNSPFGRTLVGIKENEQRMQFLGYNVRRYKWAAFVLSGSISGLAGALLAQQQLFVSTDLFHWLMSAEVIIMTWLGGVGTLIGPMLGGAIVIFFEDFFSSWMADNWLMIMGFVYVMFVLFSPRGLIGLIEKARHALTKGKE